MLVKKSIKSCFDLVVLGLVCGQLSDQIHDCFAVLLHLGAALLDVALDVVAAAGGSGGGVFGTDEDSNVVTVVVVGLGKHDVLCPCSAAPTATCATVPSALA